VYLTVCLIGLNGTILAARASITRWAPRLLPGIPPFSSYVFLIPATLVSLRPRSPHLEERCFRDNMLDDDNRRLIVTPCSQESNEIDEIEQIEAKSTRDRVDGALPRLRTATNDETKTKAIISTGRGGRGGGKSRVSRILFDASNAAIRESEPIAGKGCTLE